MGNTHKNSRKVQNKTMGLGIALSLIFLIGCNYYDVATSPESGAELAVGTRETIILSVETDEDMEPEDEPEIQIEHIDISPEGIVSARILSDYTIGIDVLAAGEAHLTIRTNLEVIEMDVVAVVPDAVRFVPWHWNPDHGGPAEAWLLDGRQDGRQDGAFVWSARGKDLHGAAVGELEISPASALLIQRYVDGRFWGDEQVTLNFVEKASVEIASHSDLPHMVFDVVDSSDIAEFEPLLLERDREDIVDGQPQADSPATFWWRVAAYDDRDRRIGGLAELISVSNHSSVACSLDTVGDEFALWRAQPGDCEVVITAEEIKQVFTITFV